MTKKNQPLAITGIACRFPGEANSINQFWEILKNRKDAIIDVPADRYNIRRFYNSDINVKGKMYIRQGGFLKE